MAEREQRLSILVSEEEHAMMLAIAGAKGEKVSDTIRRLVRAAFREAFGTAEPVESDDGDVYVWRRAPSTGEFALFHMNNADRELAILQRFGEFFQVGYRRTEISLPLVKQLARANGIPMK